MSDMPKNTPLTPKGGWRRKKESAIDTIRNSAASGEWTDTSPLTPAEAMRCPEVAELVRQARRIERDMFAGDGLTAALAPFTTS